MACLVQQLELHWIRVRLVCPKINFQVTMSDLDANQGPPPGVLIGSFISARFGRRWCMFCMSCYALVTATITVTSNKPEQIMAGRILNYVYVGMELAVVPIFQSEIGM